MLDLTTKFPYLSTLELREIRISNNDLSCILKNLKYLYKLLLELPSNELTDDFQTDAQLADLRHLTISNSHAFLTDKFIQQFLQVCPNLQSLNFEFCEKFNFRWIILTFENLKSLKDLQLSKRFLNHEELKAGKLIETIEDLKNDDFECLILDLQLYNYAFNYLKGISYKVLCRNKY